MFLLSLLTCFALSAFSAQAKVTKFNSECDKFFYKGKQPHGMDQNAVEICQKLESDEFRFATLYHVSKRIPLYSAYILNHEKNVQTTTDSSQVKSKGTEKDPLWKIEPQLCSPKKPDHMMTEGEYNKLNNRLEKPLKEGQAINSDYDETGYDRGHLLPNSFLSSKREVTFTLTNAAPMDACFNRVHWMIWEKYLNSFLKGILNRYKQGTAYIVTGTVPGENKIPQSGNRDLNRVTVPSHIWTAVCYENINENTKSFSFGYLGINQPEFNIKLMSIPEMNKKLNQLYPSNPSVKIFLDDCFSDKPASQQAQSQFLNLIKLPEHQRLQMSKALNTLLAVHNVISDDSDIESPSAKKPKITELTATLTFESSSSYFKSAETLKSYSNSACVLTGVKKRKRGERDLSEGSEFVECQLVPEKSIDEKTAADGLSCNRFVNNDDKCTCLTQNGESKKCCSTPCLYQDQLKGYYCYSGETQIQCSPQYSLITAKGNKCRDDHPCGTYSKDYYWCYINDKTWEFCSPPVWGTRAKDGKFCRINHACAKYDRIKPWCYTDEDNNWNDCCTSDSFYSTVDQKTCKPNHPCGFHGKNYLWCYTTDGGWDYCCKEFK